MRNRYGSLLKRDLRDGSDGPRLSDLALIPPPPYPLLLQQHGENLPFSENVETWGEYPCMETCRSVKSGVAARWRPHRRCWGRRKRRRRRFEWRQAAFQCCTVHTPDAHFCARGRWIVPLSQPPRTWLARLSQPPRTWLALVDGAWCHISHYTWHIRPRLQAASSEVA